MIYIGIDFSLNSPAMTVKTKDGNYHFISFYNDSGRDPKKPTPKAFQIHKELSESETIVALPYNRQVSSDEALIREREKLIDGKMIANKIIAVIKTYVGDSEVKIGLEGFSYGSTGNSFIDIVQYNTFLRSAIVEMFGADSLYVFPPSHVKKNAGKGNANKHFMANAFQSNVFNDDYLSSHKLWIWSKDKDFTEKIPKPIDDIVDSYFILQSILILGSTI
jgi:hypothetical protein